MNHALRSPIEGTTLRSLSPQHARALVAGLRVSLEAAELRLDLGGYRNAAQQLYDLKLRISDVLDGLPIDGDAMPETEPAGLRASPSSATPATPAVDTSTIRISALERDELAKIHASGWPSDKGKSAVNRLLKKGLVVCTPAPSPPKWILTEIGKAVLER